jgi:hypothetical protein
MKNLFFTCLLSMTSAFLYAVDSEVVKDSVTYKYDNGMVEMTITLDIDSNWIVYDSIAGEDGPIPFSITVDEPAIVAVQGVIKPIGLHKKHDELFEMDIYYIKGVATYVVKFLETTLDASGNVSGSYEFMSCNLVSGVCLPPQQHTFSFSVK